MTNITTSLLMKGGSSKELRLRALHKSTNQIFRASGYDNLFVYSCGLHKDIPKEVPREDCELLMVVGVDKNGKEKYEKYGAVKENRKKMTKNGRLQYLKFFSQQAAEKARKNIMQEELAELELDE